MGDWSEVAIKCKPKAYKMFEAFHWIEKGSKNLWH